MLFKVDFNGVVVPIHAKNEGQLKYAVAAMKGALAKNPNLIEQYKEEIDHGNKNARQDSTINSASFGRPYLF